jgi:3-oxoacid CoA-transferase B subunit
MSGAGKQGGPVQASAPEGTPAIGRLAQGWDRQQMADRLAREFQDGWIVNLGVGIPTLCSNTDIGDRAVIYHAENGVIGYGPVLPPGEEDLHLVNAGGQNVSLKPGAAIVQHADSFGIIRSGRIDVTVMGAYEVSAGGDFANWKVGGAKGGGIGGAMDLAACAKRVFIILEHTTRKGEPRLVRQCSLPVTARGVVTLVATNNYGLFAPAGEGFAVRELAPGISLDAVRAATGAPLFAG